MNLTFKAGGLESFDIRDMKLPGSIFGLDGIKANLVAISKNAT